MYMPKRKGGRPEGVVRQIPSPHVISVVYIATTSGTL